MAERPRVVCETRALMGQHWSHSYTLDREISVPVSIADDLDKISEYALDQFFGDDAADNDDADDYGVERVIKSAKPLTREFAFDAKLFTVVRVKALTEEQARSTAVAVVDSLPIDHTGAGVTVTEVSMDGEPDLIEVDGE
ncbi:hypothetical protein [Streptosporangium sp. KLBMP 9127]|nr:hypothetical protein [Streptosporangium sp. KLBMP 9127]